jgi:nitroreductase
VGAVEALVAYRNRLIDHVAEAGLGFIAEIESALEICTERNNYLSTPIRLEKMLDEANAKSTLLKLANARRSVRRFEDTPVPREAIEFATKVAQLSPSACNRQPVIVYCIKERKEIDALLGYQNGNRGFGHRVPFLIVLATDERCFFDASERHEPYIDAGLFSMSFILGLQACGLSSCCLNWCVPPATDKVVHSNFKIPEQSRIAMLIAVGYAEADCVVPRSPRRDLAEVLLDLPRRS